MTAVAAPPPGVLSDATTGAAALIRFIVRRDVRLLLLWVGVAVAMPLFNAWSLGSLLNTAEARQQFTVDNNNNPVLTAVLGPIYASTIEAIVVWRAHAQSVFVVALAGLLFVIRHTRTEEEAGRRELLGSTAVGRHAGLTAALVVAIGTNLLIGLLIAVALSTVAGYPVAGSVAFGLAIAGSGCVYAAVGGIVAQLAQSAGLARSIGIGALAAAFAPTIAGGGTSSSWLRWLSPIGWVRETHAYTGERWWSLLLPALTVAVLAPLAVMLSARRDLGTGVLPDRSAIGPTDAAPGLRSPLALAWRLYSNQVTSLTITFAVVSVMMGWAAATFDEQVGDLPGLTEWLDTMRRSTVGESFLAVLGFVLGLAVSCVAIVLTLRPRTEEAGGHADPVLATTVSRGRWLGSQLVIAFMAPAIILLVAGIGTGLTFQLTAGRSGVLLRQIGAMLLFLPSVWTLAAVTVALFGLVPRVVIGASWGAIAVCVVLVWLWEARMLGRGLFLATPFGFNHPSMEPGPVAPIAFTLVAAALVATGVAAFQRRDVGA